MTSVDSNYDTVVVGAGAAGAALAAALSADQSRRVLVLEAGPDYRSAETPAEIRGANFGAVLRLGRYHWTDLKAQVTAGAEPTLYLQGRGVGGSSAINGQGAVRPLPGDLDRWAAAGCKGWSWSDVLPTFATIEDDGDFGDRPYHGRGGPIPISRSADRAGPVSRALRGAALAAGYPQSPDVNAPDSSGLAPAAWHRDARGRVSSNDAFLEPVRARPNLQVRGDAPVSRVYFAGGRVSGVGVTTGPGEEIVRADEVYLCAGALQTPAILLRSGIGPPADLRRLGVDVVADLPGVGHGLQDHPMMWLRFPLRADAVVTDPDALPGHYVLRFSSGWPGALEHDLEILPLDRSTFRPDEGGLMVSLMQPTSCGQVSLVSPDPGTPPHVELGLLGRADDVRRLRRGVRVAAQLSRAPALAEVLADRLAIGKYPVDDLGDDELDLRVRTGCREYYHAAGSCRMGDPGDPATVVDPECRVLGVDGLRVVDASILPDLPRAPTYLTTVAFATHLAHRP